MEIKNCNTSSITSLNTPLSIENVKHLFRRVGFGINHEEATKLAGKNPEEVVDTIITDAINSNPIDRPIWHDWDINDYPTNNADRNKLLVEQFEEHKYEYIDFLRKNNLIGRLSFFWTSHFVTTRTSHFCNSYQSQYVECINKYSIGNFKDFTREIGLTNAMLIYLDGAFSKKDNPNENYARELYELFTLGEGIGYTEQDIVETSRALTGYFIEGVSHTKCSPIVFKSENFDNTEKEIFGKKGNWDYFDVIEILFEEKKELIAQHICRKFYNFFVHPDARSSKAEEIINELAITFVANNFEIAPVLSMLFKSEHFYDNSTVGVIIKSPFDLFLNATKELSIPFTDRAFAVIQQGTRGTGQRIFSPPDVSGWDRDQGWINSDFIINRWLFLEGYIQEAFFNDKESFRKLALTIVGDIGNTTNNPDTIARLIIDAILAKGLHSEDDYQAAFDIFRSDVSETYYEGGSTPFWTLATFQKAPTQVFLLIKYLVREPEFQLK